MRTSQSEVSKLEQRTDACISTLQNYIRALGGELDIVARFPDGSVRISQFEEAQIDGPAPAVKLV